MDRVYKPHPRYRWMALGSVLLFLLFAWNLMAPVIRSGQWATVNLDVGTLFFMAAAIGIAVWQGRMALCRVDTDVTGRLLVRSLGTGSDMSSSASCPASPKAGAADAVITLLYHPIGVNQLVDVDDLKGLALPEVVDQDSLLDSLEERVPA